MIAARTHRVIRSVTIPDWVSDLESFRRWSDSRRFPEFGRISFYDGAVHVDMSKEQLFSHVQLKSDMNYTLAGLSKVGQLGRYLGDGAYLSNEVADLSCVPDGLFFSRQ